MKMNRLISVLLVIMLVMISAAPALALTSVEKEQQYAAAIDQLETWLEGGHDVSELQGTYDAFKELGGYEQSRFMAYYTDVLIRIEDGVFNTMTEFELDTLQNDADFVKYLTDDLGGSIGTPEMLRVYAAARKLEQEGNAVEAAAVYKTCLSFYDSLVRYEDISVALFTGHYEKGVELMEAGDLEAAYRELSQAGEWEDSALMMAFIVDTLGYDPMEHVHDWQPATCTVPKICSGCGVTEGEALGHTWDEGTITTPATCISDGVMTYTCTVCGIMKTESTTIDSGNHSWLDATYDTPKTCAWCGKTEGEPLQQHTGNPRQVGSYVTFGHYPQTAEGNDNTPIEWLVLDYDAQSDRTLLISRYSLDCQRYQIGNNEITWETCSLRAWLNGIFLNNAFTEAEQRAILTTEVDNSSSQGYSEWNTGGYNTQDKIYLLSYAEANRYLFVTNSKEMDENNDKAYAAPTAFALARRGSLRTVTGGKDETEYMTADGLISGDWWLRSHGEDKYEAALVGIDGMLGSYPSSGWRLGVRPVLWLDLSATWDDTGDIENEKTSPQSDKGYNVGDYVAYGCYPQTEAGTDNTPIEWLVLDYDAENNRALLISKYGLDCKRYNDSSISVTWETCTLRTWLNSTFLNRAFSEEEQKAILLTDVDNSDSQNFDWRRKYRGAHHLSNGGNNTQDRVFLLSYAEANKYLELAWENEDNIKARSAPTDYALAQPISNRTVIGVKNETECTTVDGMTAGDWWLRSPGDDKEDEALVNIYGELFSYSNWGWALSVRPAFWLDLSGI